MKEMLKERKSNSRRILNQENIRKSLKDSNRNNFLNGGNTERKEGKPQENTELIERGWKTLGGSLKFLIEIFGLLRKALGDSLKFLIESFGLLKESLWGKALGDSLNFLVESFSPPEGKPCAQSLRLLMESFGLLRKSLRRILKCSNCAN